MYTELVVQSGVSRRLGEMAAFKRFCEFLRPNTANLTPKRTKTARLLTQKCAEYKRSLQNNIISGGKVSLSLDGWSSQNGQSFIGILGYWIDGNWNMREHLLSLEVAEGQHTGVRLAAHVLNVLKEYHIHDRILAVTADNASNNQTLLTTLSELLAKEDIEWDAANQVPCLAHTVQLVVKDMICSIRSDEQSSLDNTFEEDGADDSGVNEDDENNEDNAVTEDPFRPLNSALLKV